MLATFRRKFCVQSSRSHATHISFERKESLCSETQGCSTERIEHVLVMMHPAGRDHWTSTSFPAAEILVRSLFAFFFIWESFAGHFPFSAQFTVFPWQLPPLYPLSISPLSTRRQPVCLIHAKFWQNEEKQILLLRWGISDLHIKMGWRAQKQDRKRRLEELEANCLGGSH